VDNKYLDRRCRNPWRERGLSKEGGAVYLFLHVPEEKETKKTERRE
jgi:hypothetical protein